MLKSGMSWKLLVYITNPWPITLAQEKDYEVSVVLPNKISNYFRTLETKTITDKTASETIVMFGLERKLDLWKRPKPIFKKLRQLTRGGDQIVQERTMAKNQLHRCRPS